MKESFDRKITRPGNLYNSIDNPEIAEGEDRKRSVVGIATIAAGIAGVATAVIPKNANADESYGVGVELGPDVNWIQKEGCPTSYTPGVGGANLMHGYAPDRFKLNFSGFAYNKEDCGAYDAIVFKEFKVADALDGGITISGLGQALPMNPALVNNIIDGQSQSPWTCIEVDRGDGMTVKIKPYEDDKIFKDKENKWQEMPIDEYNPTGECYAVIDSVHSLANSQKIKIVGGTFWNTQTLDLFYSTWRININEPDYCFAIQKSINDAWKEEGKDPYEAGLLKHIEDGNMAAPESDKLLLVTGKGGVYGAGTDFVKHDPQTDQYTHLKHNADGTYTPENPQKGEADFPGASYPYKQNLLYPKALLKIETKSGRKIHLIVNEGHKINFAGGFGDIRFFAVEELIDEQGETYFKDVNITLEETNQYPDDDGDGKINHEDNCRWRANPDQVNTTADENGDACKADCKDSGWVGVDATALQTNSSGLRVCQSELGYDFAFSFEDGSTIHSNMDVEVLNGKIMLKPGQIVRVIHSWDPRTEKLSAPSISLPSGNSVKIKVNSAKNLDGIDGQMVFNHDGNSEYFNSASDWQDFGIITNGEIENASDIEIEVGNENPVPVVEVGVEVAVETSVDAGTINAETANTEPMQAEPAQNVAEEISAPDAESTQTAEPVIDTGVVSSAEPSQTEPNQNAAEEGVSIAEMPQIVVEKPNAVEEASIAEQPVAIEPTPDIFVEQPEAGTFAEIPQNDTAEQNADTNANDGSDVLQNPDVSKDAQPDTVGESTDSHFDFFEQDISTQPDTPNISQKDTGSGADAFNSADIGTDSTKLAEKEEKGGSGNGGGCSMAFVLDRSHENLPYQNPNIDGAGLLITASVLTRLYSWTRKRIAKV